MVSTRGKMQVWVYMWQPVKYGWGSKTEGRSGVLSTPLCQLSGGVCLRGSQSIRGLSSQPSLSQCQNSPIPVAYVWCHRLAGLGLEVSHVLMGSKRHPFTTSFLLPVTREGLWFLRLTQRVNFLDLLRTASFPTKGWTPLVCPKGHLLHPRLRHKKSSCV